MGEKSKFAFHELNKKRIQHEPQGEITPFLCFPSDVHRDMMHQNLTTISLEKAVEIGEKYYNFRKRKGRVLIIDGKPELLSILLYVDE